MGSTEGVPIWLCCVVRGRRKPPAVEPAVRKLLFYNEYLLRKADAYHKAGKPTKRLYDLSMKVTTMCATLQSMESDARYISDVESSTRLCQKLNSRTEEMIDSGELDDFDDYMTKLRCLDDTSIGMNLADVDSNWLTYPCESNPCEFSSDHQNESATAPINPARDVSVVRAEALPRAPTAVPTVAAQRRGPSAAVSKLGTPVFQTVV